MNRELDRLEIAKLLQKQPRGRTEVSGAAPIFDPVTTMQLQEAVKKKATEVVLNGREYTIDYSDDVFPSMIGENRLFVYVRPVTGFIPCGWFSVKTLLTEGI